MRTATAVLFGLAGICNIALAQDAACTAGAQAAYTPLAGNQDAAEYCFDKVHRSDDGTATITASATLDSLRFARRDKGKDKTTTQDDNTGHNGGDDDDKALKSLLKSLSKGPFSVASTFCSCNFPSGSQTADVTISPTGSACSGFLNATITANSTIITSTASLNATTTGDDDSTITAIATLTNDDGTVITTTIDDDNSRTSVDDSSTTSV